MKKFFYKIGNVIATLLMLSPIIVVFCYGNKMLSFKEHIILLILSIAYDIYYYQVINDYQYLEETKKLFDNVQSGKTINSKTNSEKMKWFEVICIDLFMNKFK